MLASCHTNCLLSGVFSRHAKVLIQIRETLAHLLQLHRLIRKDGLLHTRWRALDLNFASRRDNRRRQALIADANFVASHGGHHRLRIHRDAHHLVEIDGGADRFGGFARTARVR